MGRPPSPVVDTPGLWSSSPSLTSTPRASITPSQPAKMANQCCGLETQGTGLEHSRVTRAQCGVWTSTKTPARRPLGLPTSQPRWDALSGEEELTLQHKHIVKSVNFSNDSAALATGSNDKVLRIFDLEQPSEPIIKFEGHTGGIKQVMYTPDNKQLLSCSDDKTVRVWDTANGAEIKSFTTSEPIGGLELSKEGDIITLAAGHKVIFLDANRFEKIKEVNIPSPTYTASLHQDRDIFVCGGEDLKLYKFDFQTGLEIENFKGHFGPVHCVRFSPDGELYASGSEDGTLRLWQTNVGKTYGLWKCVDSVSGEPVPSTKAETLS